MNVQLLEQVRDHIVEEPRRLDMGHWLRESDEDDSNAPACGTTGCIAGWAVTIAKFGTDPKAARSAWEGEQIALISVAEEELQISDAEAEKLFYVTYWPRLLKEGYFDAEHRVDHQAMAQITAERIDHFIGTGGLE